MSDTQNKKTIIVVEDDAMLAKALNVVLLAKGYHVISASDGEAGEKAVREHKPHCVLLDMMLPKKTGFEVLESLKKDNLLSEIPVIVLSNMSQEHDIKKGLALGALDYFNKADTDITKITEKIESTILKNSNKSSPAVSEVTPQPMKPRRIEL